MSPHDRDDAFPTEQGSSPGRPITSRLKSCAAAVLKSTCNEGVEVLLEPLRLAISVSPSKKTPGGIGHVVAGRIGRTASSCEARMAPCVSPQVAVNATERAELQMSGISLRWEGRRFQTALTTSYMAGIATDRISSPCSTTN